MYSKQLSGTRLALYNFLTKNCILITGAVIVSRKGNRKAKAKPSTKQVFLSAQVFLPVHCVSQGCAEVFAPADRAVLLQGLHVNAIKPGQLCWWGCGCNMCKKKDKTACQIYSSLFQGSMSTAVLVEMHLCKGLWPEEPCWYRSSAVTITWHRGYKWPVKWLKTAYQKTHINPHRFSEPWTVTSKTSSSSGSRKWEPQVHVSGPELLLRESVPKLPAVLTETGSGTKCCKSLHDLIMTVLWANQYLGWISFCILNWGFSSFVLQEISASKDTKRRRKRRLQGENSNAP